MERLPPVLRSPGTFRLPCDAKDSARNHPAARAGEQKQRHLPSIMKMEMSVFDRAVAMRVREIAIVLVGMPVIMVG